MKISKISAALMLSLAFTGAISKAALADTSTHKLLVWEDIKKSDGIADAVKAFEAKYNVDVKVLEMPFAQQIEKLRLDGPAGIGPDVMVIPNDQIGGAVIQGLLAKLNLPTSYLNEYTQSAVDALNYKNTQYGIPKAVESLVMIYNKKMVKQAPQTMDELYQLSLKERKVDKFGLLAKFDQIYYSYGVISGMGGYIFGKNSNGSFNFNDIGLNNAGSVEAVKYIEKFFTSGAFPKGIIGSSGLNAIDTMFTEQRAAVVFNGPWAFEPYRKAGVDYGVAPLPMLPNGKHMRSFLGVKGYVVSSYSKNKELAVKFIKFINQEKYEKIRFDKTSEIPALKALLKDPDFTKNQEATAVAQQAKYATAMPNVPEMQTIWTPTNNALQLVATGKSKVAPALNTAVDNIKMQIQMTQSEQ
ncbi:extracellular solute-binding protein [Celerinatantimonas yamalensis]|uniref:Extracellular solute-binding protein n=1 Tax=Celerinatantimonas yamalensis TaxID=559956 RepID=A0ABW9G696_9GAMM